MTILCPHRFHEAVQHALEADEVLEARLLSEKNNDKAYSLTKRRGQATRTLMQCFGYRANSDHIDNSNPIYPPGSEIRFPDGIRRTVNDVRKDGLPVIETFIFDDIAPYSFFFREEYIDGITRQRVEVYDRCWYLFPKSFDRAEVESMSEVALDSQLMVDASGVRRLFHQDRVEAEIAKDPTLIVREAMKRRVGMCGGIIYHADYEDGKMMPYGSYSTHT